MDSRASVVALLAGLTVAIAGCVASSSTASSEGGDAPAPPPVVAPSRAGGATIASIRTHDGIISIASSLGGPRITLADTDGEVTARDLTLEELQVQAPDAYRLVTSSRAFLDASIDRGVSDRGARPGLDAPRPDFGDPSRR